MIGERGFPRGYKPRSDPGFSDQVPQNILPVKGQSAYSGQEILNKYKFEANPPHPMLQAAPGDYVAIVHLENGHVSLPLNQPNKPRNRGTIFFYGTSQPKDEERLFDVHLRWTKDGSGGDKRGVLLGTRHYDDGQCFQPNADAIAKERASKFSSDGAKISQELPCQSDIKLPDNLKPGSVYTVYWYWDWPDLNANKINMDKTKDGSYPWAGSFMRGDTIPNGWTMDMISKNESYSSVIDIKIVGTQAQGVSVKSDAKQEYVAKQDIYSKAIEEQMKSNFQVPVGDSGSSNSNNAAGSMPHSSAAVVPVSASGAASFPVPLSSAPPPALSVATSLPCSGVVTVTQTQMVPPTTIFQTIYRTVDPGGAQPTQPPAVGVTVTVTSHVQPPPTGGPARRLVNSKNRRSGWFGA
ncbi:hypothetical protein E4U30_003862 [Claviceps sp. LM220 group G6]|nr:hypothetical protein E4U30_003862 [Claviceps sp. LM220 group G6]KAG6113574.1 hypothetical protein E4U31_000451 [Claviceps sp. LM219 group G6]